MDLIEAIVDLYDNGTTAEAIALRALGGVGHCSADDDLENTDPPYIVVSEEKLDVVGRGLNSSYRIEEAIIQFTIYTYTRAEAVALLDALENAYLLTTLETTGRSVMGTPTFLNRLIQSEANYKGVLQLAYLLQKNG